MITNRNLTRLTMTMALTLGASSVLAQRAGIELPSRDQFPDIQCTTTSCSLVYGSAGAAGPRGNAITANPNPVVVAPPAGQRYLWQGAGYPACQDIKAMSPQPTMATPYEYIAAAAIPVPLGSTHASLLGNFQVNLARGATGNAANIGMLQIRRSGGTWANVSNSYAYTIHGTTPPQSLYNMATYHGLVGLADLPGGTTVPDLIDVRLAVWPLYTNLPANDLVLNKVCSGQLQVAF